MLQLPKNYLPREIWIMILELKCLNFERDVRLVMAKIQMEGKLCNALYHYMEKYRRSVCRDYFVHNCHHCPVRPIDLYHHKYDLVYAMFYDWRCVKSMKLFSETISTAHLGMIHDPHTERAKLEFRDRNKHSRLTLHVGKTRKPSDGWCELFFDFVYTDRMMDDMRVA